MTFSAGRAALALALAVLFGAAPASAQRNNFTVGGAPAAGRTCVQTRIGNAKPSLYDCLNQQLQQQAAGANSTLPTLPLGATSPSNAVGMFNEQGLREQYGQNFGHSVIPYRPPPPVYGNALRP